MIYGVNCVFARHLTACSSCFVMATLLKKTFYVSPMPFSIPHAA